MDLHAASRLLALKAVTAEEPPSDYVLRRIFRWYSEKFCTPLHLVEELPLQDVMVAYWESQYEDMKPEEREEEIRLLTMSSSERDAERAKQEAEDLDTYWFVKETEKENTQNATKAKKDTQAKEGSFGALRPPQKQRFPQPGDRTGAEPSLPIPSGGDEEISMEFVDLEDFEELVASDGISGLTDLD